MCMYDDADTYAVQREKIIKKCKKEHKCGECRRVIGIGESYKYLIWIGGYASPITGKVCTHCCVAQEWLTKHCGGWAYPALLEDLQEHFFEGYRKDNVARLIVGIKRDWKKFKSNDLMPIPTLN